MVLDKTYTYSSHACGYMCRCIMCPSVSAYKDSSTKCGCEFLSIIIRPKSAPIFWPVWFESSRGCDEA